MDHEETTQFYNPNKIKASELPVLEEKLPTINKKTIIPKLIHHCLSGIL